MICESRILQDRMERFIPELLKYMEDAVQVEADINGNMIIKNPDAKYLIVNQDEKINHSNDVQPK